MDKKHDRPLSRELAADSSEIGVSMHEALLAELGFIPTPDLVDARQAVIAAATETDDPEVKGEVWQEYREISEGFVDSIAGKLEDGNSDTRMRMQAMAAVYEALTLHKAGDHRGYITILRYAHDLMVQVLGSEHPSIVRMGKVLALTPAES